MSRPVAKACYACGQAGHLKRDCPDGAGGRGPHPARRRSPIPQVGHGGREPRRLWACWACGRRGHLERECPGPRNKAQGNPGRVGPAKDKRMTRPGAARRRDACWGCREPGHIRRHCPLRRTEESAEEVLVAGGSGGARAIGGGCSGVDTRSCLKGPETAAEDKADHRPAEGAPGRIELIPQTTSRRCRRGESDPLQ
uniref:CCHC-type domain-containing protein n=1 Tax=Terrapene triunguis TaxID=2587831 RepID=A0A674IBH4_9SAUR